MACEQQVYIGFGRVSEMEDRLLSVKAKSKQEAKQKMEAELLNSKEWRDFKDPEHPVWVEQVELASEVIAWADNPTRIAEYL